MSNHSRTLLSLVLLSLAACRPSVASVDAADATPAAEALAVEAPELTAEQHYTRAHELAAAGRLAEARAEAELAITGADSHDARLLAAKLAILGNDLAGARTLLDPLAADPHDALTHYNLGLIAHRSGEYNRARSEYLAALRADPKHAASRHNLALLTWDAGVTDEARHHARKFIEISPDDPRAAEMRARLEHDATPARIAAR